ncbi:MAG: hypothetical protein LM580_07035 [Thermofilum sp.]|nr:hypothetical protein [Thermofilum sp.]
MLLISKMCTGIFEESIASRLSGSATVSITSTPSTFNWFKRALSLLEFTGRFSTVFTV